MILFDVKIIMILFYKKNKKQNGVILLLTMFILSGILIITLGAADLVMAGIKMNRLTGYSSLGFFASEAGLEQALWEVRKNNYVLPDVDQDNIFQNIDIGNNSSYIVSYATSSPNVTFTSVGFYGGAKRSVQSSFEFGSVGGGPACTPDCTGKECGDDGCGGSCGSCSADQFCSGSLCAANWRIYNCPEDIPPVGTVWNNVSSYRQTTLDGITWTPVDDPITEHHDIGSDTNCRYKCADNYHYDGEFCVVDTYTLTIDTAGTGSGTVTGAGTYNYNTAVTATASASTGSTFTGWSGDCNASGQVTMTSNKTCTATFTLSTYTLTVNKAGTGSGTVTGAGTYNYNTAVTATASASTGSTFTGWSGDCNASGQVTMTSNKTCTATFTLSTYTLTVNKAGTGSGTVTGAGTYNYNTAVTATASASTGSTFTGWSGDCNSSGQVTMTSNKTCTATFTVSTYTLTINKAGVGSGTVTGAGTYNYNTAVTATASASTGSTFTGWSGDCNSSGQVTMTSNKTCTATFTCATNYTWNSGSGTCVANTRMYTCPAKPTNGTAWNTVSQYQQTWSGSAWLPASDLTTEYNTSGSTTSCRFTCASGYTWGGYSCSTFIIGQTYQGGRIAYIDTTGLHGVISALSNQSSGVAWITGGNTQTTLNGNTSIDLGTGQANTNAMKAQTGYTGGAAKVCDDYTNTNTGTGVYSDWYLPSKYELHELYINRVVLRNFVTTSYYWSSSEGIQTPSFAMYELFTDAGGQSTSFKAYSSALVRCTRSF